MRNAHSKEQKEDGSKATKQIRPNGSDPIVTGIQTRNVFQYWNRYQSHWICESLQPTLIACTIQHIYRVRCSRISLEPKLWRIRSWYNLNANSASCDFHAQLTVKSTSSSCESPPRDSFIRLTVHCVTYAAPTTLCCFCANKLQSVSETTLG